MLPIDIQQQATISIAMRISDFKQLASKVYEDFGRTRVTAVAGGLAFFFLLSLVPLMILAATVLGLLSVPGLFQQSVTFLARFVPSESMGFVRGVLKDVLTPAGGGLLTVGILGTLWSASGGFSATIDALDIAYDAKNTRSFWRQSLLAIELTFVVGGLFALGLAASILGPRFGNWLATLAHINGPLVHLWPLIRWGVMIVCVVLAVELLYYLAPNVKQQFRDTLPGAIIATIVWIIASFLLGLYISHFGNYNKTYGSLGAVIALMLWFWVTSIILIVGAELNSELQRMKGLRFEGQGGRDNAQDMAEPPKAA